jgi:hypothetical protein
MKALIFAGSIALIAFNASSCLASEGKPDRGLETASLATEFVKAAPSESAPSLPADARDDANGTTSAPSSGPMRLMAKLGTDRI